MVKLTVRQAEVLDLIRSQIEATGLPPTRAEIARQLGFRSANAAEEHLKALARKGAIEMIAGTSRGIRIVDEQNTPDQNIPSGLPVIGQVAAGSPLLAAEHIETYCDINPGFFQPRADYFLRVRGMSMKDIGILDGDLLAVHKTHEARNGQIVVARIDDEVTVKRFERQKERILLHPENPDFDTIVVEPSSGTFAIEGLSVGVLRNN